MQVGYCRLVTISTDNLLETNEFGAGVAPLWPFLSTPGAKCKRISDIAEYTDPHHNPMIPHMLVLEPGPACLQDLQWLLVLRPPTVEELRLDLRALGAQALPSDWTQQREQRAAWAKGEKTGFYPYGKTQRRCWASRIDC